MTNLMRNEEGGIWLVDIGLKGKDWEDWESGLEKDGRKWHLVEIGSERRTGTRISLQWGQGRSNSVNGSGWDESGVPPLALEVRRTRNLSRKKTVENGIMWKLDWREELGREYCCSEGKGEAIGLMIAGRVDWKRHHWILRWGEQGKLYL